jgi:cytochrome oxidase Cu insertion factor (SCO1/SenC/PrrC family)
VSAHQPSVSEGKASGSPRLFRWVLWSCVALIGVLGGLLIGLITMSHKSAAVPNGPVGPVGPAATWSAGAKLAPGFSLTDQSGRPVSLAAYRGRPVIVTFIDPLCRNFCPLEAKVLNDVVAKLPAVQRPAIVAVSVNLWGNAHRYLVQDVHKWRLTPQWRWGVGNSRQLESVWKAYQIEVLDQPKTIAGVTVHQITHTEGAFIVDPSGHQRALYLWPFRAVDVTHTLRQLAASS